MSINLLEKLKKKPITQKESIIKITLNRPASSSPDSIPISTKIIDKTQDNIIDRNDFIKNLNLKIKEVKNIKPLKKLEDDKVQLTDTNYITNISLKPLRKITITENLSAIKLGRTIDDESKIVETQIDKIKKTITKDDKLKVFDTPIQSIEINNENIKERLPPIKPSILLNKR